MARTRKLARRQWLVTVTGESGAPVISGTFLTKSGGTTSVEASKVYDGGSEEPDILTGMPNLENVVLGRIYDQDRDGPIIAALRPIVGRGREFTVTCQPLDRDYRPYGRATVYTGCELVRTTDPDADGSSSDPNAFELEFMPRSVTTA